MKKRQPFYENSHFLLKTSIGLTATAYPTALFVTLVFWSFLFNYNETFHFNLGSWINLTVHLFQVSIYCKEYSKSLIIMTSINMILALLILSRNSKYNQGLALGKY